MSDIVRAPDIIMFTLRNGNVLLLPGDVLHGEVSLAVQTDYQHAAVDCAKETLRRAIAHQKQAVVESSDKALEERARIVVFLRAQASAHYGQAFAVGAEMVERGLHWREP